MSDMPADPTRDTRGRILEAFTTQLRSRGYLGASLDAVASETGIRKASLYHHFPGGKEEMYREAALTHIAREAARVERAVTASDVLEDRLVAVALLDVDHAAAEPDLDQQIYDGTRHVSDETRTAVSTAYVSGLIGPVVALMGDGVTSGEVAGDPEFLAWSFLNLAKGVAPLPDDVAMPPEERGPRTEPAESARAVVRLFLDGARPRGTS